MHLHRIFDNKMSAQEPTRADILDHMLESLKHKTSKTDINESSSFTDIGMDSLDVVEAIMEIETKYAIQLSDDETSKINSVGELVSLIEEKVKANK